jgi:hypothetical protein
MPPSARATSQSVSLLSRCLSNAERVLNCFMHLLQQLADKAFTAWIFWLSGSMIAVGNATPLGSSAIF